MNDLSQLVLRNRAGEGCTLTSVCSANEDVLLASLLLAKETHRPIVIEATSNQSNQYGGYTGLTPVEFVNRVKHIAATQNIDVSLFQFGGDHLGPQVWKDEPQQNAMAKAHAMIQAYVEAGFTKIHLDCSEGCQGEPAQVDDETSAARAVALAQTCEAHAPDPSSLSYIVGTEVPPPGGARVSDQHVGIAPTSSEHAGQTLSVYEKAFENAQLQHAWKRVVGLVVQPGLEFGPMNIDRLAIVSQDNLSAALQNTPHIAFEAHSTDYQYDAVYPELAHRHFAFLKVGPALTYAYRQALYALNHVRKWCHASDNCPDLPSLMEQLMREQPEYWRNHYSDSSGTLQQQLHFSYADRIRYYWPTELATRAVTELLDDLSKRQVSDPIIEQYFAPVVFARAKTLQSDAIDWPKALILAQVQTALLPYLF